MLRTDFLSDPHNRLFLAYAQSVGELDHPKRALQLLLRDGQRLAAYQQACAALLRGTPRPTHVGAFCHAHAAQANARLCSRLAQESSQSSARGLELRASTVSEHLHSSFQTDRRWLSPRTEPDTCSHGHTGPHGERGGRPGQRQPTGRVEDAVSCPASRVPCHRLVTLRQYCLTDTALPPDMFDHTLLGLRIGEALRGVAEEGLVDTATQLLPSRATVFATVVELCLSDVSGFDLSAINKQLWSFSAQPVLHSRHRRLTEAFKVSEIDFQAWLEAILAGDAIPTLPPTSFSCKAIAGGTASAVEVWYELDDLAEPSSTQSRRTALYHLDTKASTRPGSVIKLVAQYSSDAFHFVLVNEGSCSIPRHNKIQEWHFDLLYDKVRNSAYQRAIERRIKNVKAEKEKEVRMVHIAWQTDDLLLCPGCRARRWFGDWASRHDGCSCRR